MIPDYVKSTMADYHNQYSEIAQELFTFWLSDIVFTFPWWIGLLLIVMPWLIWFFYREKINTHKYLYSGFFVIIISSYLDFLGIQAGLWVYHIEVIPTIPAYFLWDFSILPVIAMLLIQYKPQMSVYYKAAIYSLGSSFLGEPLFEAIGFYKKIHWEYYYSVPIQFIIFVIASILYSKIDK